MRQMSEQELYALPEWRAGHYVTAVEQCLRVPFDAPWTKLNDYQRIALVLARMAELRDGSHLFLDVLKSFLFNAAIRKVMLAGFHQARAEERFLVGL
jgi:hypothetical protein